MLYTQAARVIESTQEQKGSLKSLVFASKAKNQKQLYALVCETLKFRDIINTIVKETALFKREKFLKKNPVLAQVLVYEFLFGKGIRCSGKMKNVIMSHKAALQASLTRIKIKQQVSKNQDLLPKDVTQQEWHSGYDYEHHDIRDGYQCVSSLKKKQFMKDLHFDDLLVFAPNTDLHDNVLYQQGDIILQDKASCIPAHVLCPPLGSHVIDTCAAPGNKTSHLASIINNTGKIYAFDLDTKRIGTMGNLTAKAGVMNTQLFNQDFLKTNPTDNKFQKVEYILVDPSCTGSGIVNRNDHLMGAQGITKARLRSLSSFQVMILKHAMEFPNLKRVVYSTCSVHREENEDVVAEVLKCNKNFALKTVMPSWTHRGLEGTDVGKHCIRASANVDFTNGFFVALFERTEMKFEKQAAFDDRRGDTSEKFAHDGNGDDTPQKGCRYEEDNLSTTRTKPDVTASVQRTVGVKRASDSVGKKKKKKRKKQFKPVTAK
uniref:Methyltransferase NSUN5-like n=1 Tax=Saccoglossus kowalevskii TaxID=10224 RepID=A0ABM0MKC3_SACKO|nr:PREDICTED: putative methyltransferase NSUN5-like [Saccoglossus kowalevskii]